MRRATTIALLLLAASGCRRADGGATARPISSARELLWGASAFGAMSDIRLENPRVIAIVTRAERSLGFATSGGNIVDLAPVGGEDHLNQVFLYLNDEFPRQARYTSVEIVAAGGPGRTARVRARGTDTGSAKIQIETDYVLGPDADDLTLISRFTNTSSATIRSYRIGDALQWGRAEHLAPGHGFEIIGKHIKTPWIAGIGEDTSYAYVAENGAELDTPNGSVWSDPIGARVDIPVGQTVTYTRHIIVGHGDTASLMPSVERIGGTKFARVLGSLSNDGRPIEGMIRFFDAKGKEAGSARVGANGQWSMSLVPGRYTAQASAPGRRPSAPKDVADAFEVGLDAPRFLTFELGPASSLSWRIDPDQGRAPPVKVTVHGVDGTPEPFFGPVFRAAGAHDVILSARGTGDVPLAPGRYRVIVTRGPEYEAIDRSIELDEGGTAQVSGQLVRAIDTSGFVSADLHQHSAPSFDSGVALADRVLSNATEGLEVMIATEHNVITDFRPVIAASGLGRHLTFIAGTEATTHSVGHFNAFPMTTKLGDERGGMVDPEGMTPAEIVGLLESLSLPGIDPFIQANHPRAGRIGYFSMMKLDPQTGSALDPRFVRTINGLEVVSLRFTDETDEVQRDWFNLLRRGIRLTSTGGSDSHTIHGREVGWPRTFVCSETDDPNRLDVAAFTDALRRGCATVSGGPFLVISIGDVRMGGTAVASRGEFTLDVDLQAASWIPTDRLTIYVDGEPSERIALPANRDPKRFHAAIPLRCREDCFVVARVDADEPLSAYVTDYEGSAPRPIALTNPIYVTVDRAPR